MTIHTNPHSFPRKRTSRSSLTLLLVAVAATAALLAYPACFLSAAESGSAAAASEQFAKGNTLFQQGKFVEAIVEYKQVIAAFPDQGESGAKAQLAIGKSYAALKDVENAQSAFRAVSAKYPSFPVVGAWAQIHLAHMYRDRLMYTEAATAYNQLVSKYKDQKDLCIAALNSLATMQQMLRKNEDALATLQRIVDEFPVSSRVVSEAMNSRADIFTRKGNREAAFSEMEKLKEMYPSDRHLQINVTFQMAKYIASTDRPQARELAKELSADEIVQGSPDLLHDLVMFQSNELMDDAWRQTAERYVTALIKAGDIGRADFAQVEIAYYFEHDCAKTARVAGEFLEKHPTHGLAAEASYRRGNCLALSGDNEGALAAYEAVDMKYSKAPGVPAHWISGALHGAATILSQSGRTDEAIKRLERVVVTTPSEIAHKLDQMGHVNMKAQRWNEAAEFFRREAEVKYITVDTVCRATYNLGLSLDKLGDAAAAGESMQKIVDECPSSYWAQKAREMLRTWGMAGEEPATPDAVCN